jgi:hypothetical protein
MNSRIEAVSHAEAQGRKAFEFPALRALAPLREILGLLLALFLIGCGAGDGAVEVAGDVTLDGKPIEEGVIHFMPVDGKSRTTSTFIRGGRFQTRVPPGKQRVEISSVQARPVRPGQDADSATGGEIVPAKYNTKSELQADVNRGKSPIRFELSTK